MVSKIPTTLASSLCLLSAIASVLPSNPDSEMVQYPVKDPQSAGKESMNVQNEANRPTLAVVNDRYAGVKVLRPYYTGLGIVWREIATSTGDETIRIRDRGSFLEVTRINRNNLTGPVGVSYSQRPSGYGGRVTVNLNNNVPYVSHGNVRNSNVRSGYVPSGNRRPSGNVPNSGIKGGSRRTSPHERTVTPQPSRNNQNNFGVTSPSTSSGRISPDANLFAAIVNDFTFKMLRPMRIESNFVVSPLSIFTALSMLYLGSGGRTKAQLEEVLGLNDYAVHGLPLHRGISDLLSMATPDSVNEYKLLVASGLFFGKDFAVQEPFLEEVKRFYAAEVRNVDFSDSSATLKTLNDWVAKKTKGNIPTLIESPLPEETRLVLMNAIFFKGVWKLPFPESATYTGTFYSTDGSEIKVPYMTRYRAAFPFHRSEEHKHTFVKLPYQGGQVSMIIALPFENEDIPMPYVTDQILCHVQDAMKSYQLGVISVPRFRVEFLRSLKEPLENLGLNDLFGRSVNLTEMRKRNDVFVSEVLHKAVIDVNEKGTTASAATDVQIVPLSGGGENFVANHPFAFFVVHDASGLVLFSGQVHDPLEGVISHDEATEKPPLGRFNVENPVPQSNRREYFGRRV